MADDSVQVKFGAQIDGLIAGVESVKASISSITAPINSAVSAFSDMKEVLIAAFAVDKAAEFVDRITEVGEQILRGTQMTGLSAQEFQTLSYAMEVTGGHAGNLGITIDRLEKNIAQAREGSGQAYQAFQVLGIGLDDLKTRTPYQIIQQIADGFHNLKDPVLAAAAATEVGSRGFAQMLPALKAGSEGLREFGETFKNTGAYLNDAQAGAFAATHESLVQLQSSVEGTGVQFVRLFKPAIDLTVTALTELVQWLNKVIGGLADMVQILEGAVLLGFAKCIEEVEKFGVEANLVVEKLKAAWQALGRIISDVAHGSIGQASKEWQVAQQQMDAAMKKSEASLADYSRQYDNLRQSIAQATGALTNFWSQLGEKKGEGGSGAGLAKGSGKDAELEMALDDIKTEEQIAKLQLQTQRDIDAQAVAYKTESKQQEIEAVKRAADAEYGIDRDALEQKLSLYSRGSVEYEKTLNEMDVLYYKHTETIARLDSQMAQANAEQIKKTQAEYKSFFDTIDKSMDSMLQGVLQGTQRWQQAMAKLFDNLALSFIEDIGKMLLKATALQGINLFGGAGGNLSKAIGGEVPQALGGSQNNASNPLTAILTTLTTAISGNTAAQTTMAAISEASNTITQTTGTVVTGLSTATLANTTATIANTAGEAGSSGGGFLVLLGHLIPSFDTGTSYAPGGLSILHPGEIVLNPQVSAGVRSGSVSIGGSGQSGGNVTFNVNAVDAQSVANLFKSNGAVLASVLAGQSRNFNPNLRVS